MDLYQASLAQLQKDLQQCQEDIEMCEGNVERLIKAGEEEKLESGILLKCRTIYGYQLGYKVTFFSDSEHGKAIVDWRLHMKLKKHTMAELIKKLWNDCS